MLSDTYNFAKDPLSTSNLFMLATPSAADTYSAAANGYTPAPTGTPAPPASSWTSWISPTLNGLTGLAGSAASIYSAATGGKAATAPKPTATVAQPGASLGGISMPMILLIGGGILAAVLILPKLMARGK